MSEKTLLSSLAFTKSAGKLESTKDKVFNDLYDLGGYPTTQDIQKLTGIEVYVSGTGNNDVINGLRVFYKVGNQTISVDHGILSTMHGNLSIGDDQYLVGASGQFRNSDVPHRNGRISFIEFAVYDKKTGKTAITTLGIEKQLGSWGNYGPVIALHGTVSGTNGLTTLGFVKIAQGVEEYGIKDY